MTNLSNTFLAAALGLLPLLAPLPALAENRPLTMEAYCDLAKRLYALSELELQERVTAAEQLRGDKQAVIERFERIRQNYQPPRGKLYTDFETGSGAFGQYSHENRDAIAAYLEERPALRNEIEALKDRIQALADRVEAILSAANAGGAQ